MTSPLFSQWCAIERRGVETGRDRYNQPIYGPAEVAEVPCWWEPVSTTEDIAAAEQYTLMINLYLPPQYRPVIEGCDAVTVHGRTYQVVGRPQVQPGGFVVDGYVKVLLEEVTG